MSYVPLRNEDGPRDWEPAPGSSFGATKHSGLAWRVTTIAFAGISLALALLLYGFASGAVQPSREEIQGVTEPLPVVVQPTGEELVQIAVGLGAVLESNHTAGTGWPSTIHPDESGLVTTADGTVLGTIPIDTFLSYDAPPAGGFALGLRLVTGEGGGMRTSDYPASDPPAPFFAVQTIGTMSYVMKQSFTAWPDALYVNELGQVTAGNIIVGLIPPDSSFTYMLSPNKTNYTITLTLSDGTGAIFSTVTGLVDTFAPLETGE